MAGQIIILNGAPRSGKSSIAAVIQQRFPGIWMNIGVDRHMAMTPESALPGIGLRPGGERTELEPLVATLYFALYDTIAAHSRLGLHVVADLGHHGGYATMPNLLPACAHRLRDLPVLFAGVFCPLPVIMERRRATGWHPPDDAQVPAPVQRWQEQVHHPGIYDLTLDTSLCSPEGCADRIWQALQEGTASAFERLAVRYHP